MRLQTLGGLRLLGADVRRPKGLLLLAYLAVEGPQDRRFLADLFWPRAANRRNSLAKALSQLRKEAPGAVEGEERRVRLGIESDVEELLLSIDEGDARRSVELYPAPFLDRFYLAKVGAELEEWVFSTRESLASRVRSRLIELAASRAAGGRVAEAAAHAEAACAVAAAPALDPHEIERLYPILVVGNSSLAGPLRSEAAGLGMDLAMNLEEARIRLSGRRADGRLPRTLAGSDLPTRGTAFVGRDLEAAELSAMLLKDDSRLVTVVGPGGVGKTRLAIQVAQQLDEADGFPDGVAFVALESLSDADAIPLRVAEALGVDLKGRDAPWQEVKRHLSARTALLVLDNLEHLRGGVAFVHDLLRSCPGLTCLATSRERLRLEDEWLFALGGLLYPSGAAVGVERARDYDAANLLVDRVRRVRRDFEIDEDTWPGIADLCELVEGSPLALELAAPRARILPLEEIAREIRSGADILSADTYDLPARQKSVRATFEYSWDLLEPREREALARLSVFSGGCTREAAREVAGVGIGVLQSLADKAFLKVFGDGRFGRHALLGRFVEEKLAARPEERRAVRARHARYFAAWAERARPHLVDEQQSVWLRRFALEHDNLRAGLDWAVEEGDAETALRLVVGAGPFWRRRALFDEGRRWLDRVLPMARVASFPLLHAQALTVAGDMARRLDNYRAALSLYDRSLEIYREIGDGEGVAAALMVTAIVRAERGDYDASADRFAAALAIYRELGHGRGTAAALNNLANLAELRGNYEEARSLNEESLFIKKGLGDVGGMAVSYSNLGLIATHQGDYPAARAFLGSCLEIERELDERANAVLTLNYLGVVAQRQGDFGEARTLHHEALSLAREIGDKAGLAETQGNLGRVAAEQGDHVAARVLHEESLAIGRELGNRFGVATPLGDLGHVALYLGNFAEARALQLESLEIQRELGAREGIARSLHRLGVVAAEQGDVGEARGLQEEGLGLRRELGSLHEVAESLTRLGDLEHGQGRLDAARSRYDEGLAIWRDLENRHGLALLLARYAGLEASLDRPEGAARAWGAAESVREAIGVPVQPFERGRYDRDVASARARAGAERFAAAWRDGRAMELERAIASVRSNGGLRLDRP